MPWTSPGIWTSPAPSTGSAARSSAKRASCCTSTTRTRRWPRAGIRGSATAAKSYRSKRTKPRWSSGPCGCIFRSGRISNTSSRSTARSSFVPPISWRPIAIRRPGCRSHPTTSGNRLPSYITLLVTVCMLGLGTLLIGELKHQPGKEESLISAALIVVGVVGGCFGIVFALVAPYLSADFDALRANIQIIILFALGVSLTAITLVLDQAFIGLLRGELQLWRNSLFALVKLAALFVIGLWFSNKVGMTIYATWVVGIVLSLVILAGFAILKGHYSERIFQPEWELLRKQSRSALQHHTLNLTLQ